MDPKEFLADLIKRMNEQDNRGTASPYYFVVQEQCIHEGSDGEEHHWEDRVIAFTKDGAETHLSLNKHNYGVTRIYVKHNFRVPEVEEMFVAIGKLVGIAYEHR